MCLESFFYKSGLRTHMEHVHPKQKANDFTILDEQIARQEKVLSTIPKPEVKKGKNNKKETGKGKKSKISENKQPSWNARRWLKVQNSDIDTVETKKKYELRNRKQDEDISDNSMSLTDVMSILDKHKTLSSVAEEDVTKEANDKQEIDIERKPRRRTRSSIGKQTITEILDEIFEADNSQKHESMKKRKIDDK